MLYVSSQFIECSYEAAGLPMGQLASVPIFELDAKSKNIYNENLVNYMGSAILQIFLTQEWVRY